MSTLRISNIEAKSVPASATIDEKVKITNSSGDPLVFIDGKTSGITTVGINTTDPNITFDANSNVVVTGIITATKFSGQFEPTSVGIADSIFHTGDTDTSINFPAADTITAETSGNERLRIDSDGDLIHTANDKTLSLVTTRNVSQAGTKIAFFGADRYDTDEEFAAIKGLLVSNSGGSGNKQNGGLQFVVGNNSHTHAMTQGGFVGLGTANPITKVHISGANGTTNTLRIDSDTTAISINDHSETVGFIGNDSGKFFINAGGSEDTLLIKTNGHERLRIDSSGHAILKATNAAFKSESSSSGDYVRMYAAGGTGKWDIYGNGANLRFSDNDSAGNIQMDRPLSLPSSNIVMGSGYGIDFSATSDASGKTSELLDDYEEGDFTPSYDTSIASGSITVNSYSVQYGKYVKIGKMVFVEGLLRGNVTNNSNGTFDIAGLPFTVSGSSNSSAILHGTLQSSWTVAPDHFSCVGNTTNARARNGLYNGAGTYTNGNTSGFNSGNVNNNRFYFSGCYLVD